MCDLSGTNDQSVALLNQALDEHNKKISILNKKVEENTAEINIARGRGGVITYILPLALGIIGAIFATVIWDSIRGLDIRKNEQAQAITKLETNQRTSLNSISGFEKGLSEVKDQLKDTVDAGRIKKIEARGELNTGLIAENKAKEGVHSSEIVNIKDEMRDHAGKPGHEKINREIAHLTEQVDFIQDEARKPSRDKQRNDAQDNRLDRQERLIKELHTELRNKTL